MKRDLNELYGMVCSDRCEYVQAVQAVVIFSGLHGEKLVEALPKYIGKPFAPQPEPTIDEIRGVPTHMLDDVSFMEHTMSPYEGGQPLDDIIMGGSEAPDIVVDFPDFVDANFADFDPILPQVDNEFLTYANTEFTIA